MGCTVSRSTDAIQSGEENSGPKNFSEKSVEGEDTTCTPQTFSSSQFDNSTELEVDAIESQDAVQLIPVVGEKISRSDKPSKENEKSPKENDNLNYNGDENSIITVPSSAIEVIDVDSSNAYEYSRTFRGVSISQTLLCKDEFYSKYTNQKMYRWRQAEIVDIEGDDQGRLLIHYIGWSDSFDHWVDLNSEWFRLAPIGLLSKAECDKGLDLDEYQQKAVINFLVYGENNFENTRESRNSSRGNRHSIVKYVAGQMVEIQNFYELEEGTTYRWQKAKIIKISGTSLFVQYLDKSETVIDLQTQSKRVRESSESSSSRHRQSHDSHHGMSKNSSTYLTSDETLSGQEDISPAISHRYSTSSTSNLSSKHGNNHSSGRSRRDSYQQEDVLLDGSGGNGSGVNNLRTPRTRRRSARTTPVTSPSAVYVNIPLANEIIKSEQLFVERLQKRGMHIVQIEGDGNCLFRAVSHQIYFSESRHEELRVKCVKHMIQHRKRFEMFCDGNFDDHVKEMKILGTWGDDLEIRALEEIIDRIICIYSSNMDNVDEPTNKNFEEVMCDC